MAAVGYVDASLNADLDNATYSVANRSDNGMDGYGFKTLAAALARMPAGSTIYVREGTYQAHASDFACFEINKACTIEGYGSERPIFTYSLPASNSTIGHIFNVSVADVTLRNLEFIGAKAIKDTNTVDQGSDCVWGNHTQSGTFTVENCVIHDGADKGVRTVMPNCQVIAQNNLVYDIGTDNSDNGFYISSAGDHSVVRYNAIWNAAAGGIRFGAEDPTKSPKYGEVYGNAVFNCDFGIILWGTEHRCYNNTVTGCVNGFRTWRSNYVFGPIEVFNNILWGNTYDVRGEGGNVDFPWAVPDDYDFYDNIIHTVLGNAETTTADWIVAVASGRIDADPLFVASVTEWTDMRLQAGSPAIDAATEAIALLGSSNTMPVQAALSQNFGAFHS